KRDVNNRNRWSRVGGKVVETFHDRVRVAIREYAERIRNFDRVTRHTCLFVGNAADAKWRGLLGLKLTFQRGEFYRLSFGDCLRNEIAAQWLQDRTHATDDERDVQRRFVKAIPAIAH